MTLQKFPGRMALLATFLVLGIGTASAADNTSAAQKDSSSKGDTAGSSAMEKNQAEASGSSGQSGTAGAGATGKDQSSQGGGTKQQNAAGKSKAADAPIYMLIPLQTAERDNSMKNGCWAKVYSQSNYGGDSLTLVGPVDMADMSGPFGLDWDDKVKSVETGKNATMTVYDNEGFKDPVGEFKPGKKVADVSKRMGFFDEFASVRITCGKS